MKARFDFETPVNRRDSGSYKWDADLPEGVVLTPAQRERVIPLWVADMDFQAAPCILDALRRRVEHGVFGYTRVPDSYYDAVQFVILPADSTIAESKDLLGKTIGCQL